MINWKEVADAFGGGKSISLGALLLVFLYMAGRQYFLDQAEAIATTHSNQIEIMRRVAQLEYMLKEPRFTKGDGERHELMILQNKRDIERHELRGHQ